MSLIKCKRQENIILDFSEYKVSKNRVRQSLRFVNIIHSCYDNKRLTIFDNIIKIGPYYIKLILNDKYNCQKLKGYGKFQVRIFENYKEIKISKDNRFKTQNWIKGGDIKICTLTEIILHCHRLHKLKLFL